MTETPSLPKHPLKVWRERQTYQHPRTHKVMMLSLNEAGRRVGVTGEAWLAWEKWPHEKGHRMPSGANLAKLSRMTGLSPCDFLPAVDQDAA